MVDKKFLSCHVLIDLNFALPVSCYAALVSASSVHIVYFCHAV